MWKTRCAGVEGLAVTLNEERFVIEGITLTGGAGHEELDDAFGFCAMMKAPVELGARLRGGGEEALLAEQLSHGNAAEAAAEAPEEFTAINEARVHHCWRSACGKSMAPCLTRRISSRSVSNR